MPSDWIVGTSSPRTGMACEVVPIALRIRRRAEVIEHGAGDLGRGWRRGHNGRIAIQHPLFALGDESACYRCDAKRSARSAHRQKYCSQQNHSKLRTGLLRKVFGAVSQFVEFCISSQDWADMAAAAAGSAGQPPLTVSLSSGQYRIEHFNR